LHQSTKALKRMSRYYPGLLAALFIVLLRIAIGWHFLYEGWEKFESTFEGKEPFSAEIYLRNAAGPLAPFFRGMLPDADGKALLDAEKLRGTWTVEVRRIAHHYAFNLDQQSQAQKILDDNLQWAAHWFDDPENAQKRAKYLHDLSEVERTERNPHALSYEKERARDARRALDADRRALIEPLLERDQALRDAVSKLASFGQQTLTGTHQTQWTSLDVVNYSTIFGLIAIGLCLIAGLLTPLAALLAAAFLSMIYLSMPPWPGLPPNPKAEGHYWIVSKNLIELIACLVIATTPSGHWIGFDALFFAARRRRRLAVAARHGDQQSGRKHRDQPLQPRPIG
jgi:uncharacterized membrane protein YphA (DoxX/SURF4 family)